MADEQLTVVFRGRLVAGADPAQVRSSFTKLFNIDAERVEKMFSGQPVIIKKGLDAAAAAKYQAALAKAGAVVEVLDATATPAVAVQTTNAPLPAAMATPLPVAAPAAITSGSARLDPVAARAAPPAALRGTPQALATSMAEPGVVLVEAQPVPAAAIDVGHLSLAEVGVTLVDYAPPAAPQYDLSAFTLAPPGTVLIEPRTGATPQFDLSGLSLDELARPPN